MQFSHVDQYIAKFEDLARLAGYTLGSEETNNLFIKGLSYSILDEVLRPPFAMDYEDWKKAIDTMKARQMVDAIQNKSISNKSIPRTKEPTNIPTSGATHSPTNSTSSTRRMELHKRTTIHEQCTGRNGSIPLAHTQ
jgi:hypothetical protein